MGGGKGTEKTLAREIPTGSGVMSGDLYLVSVDLTARKRIKYIVDIKLEVELEREQLV